MQIELTTTEAGATYTAQAGRYALTIIPEATGGFSVWRQVGRNRPTLSVYRQDRAGWVDHNGKPASRRIADALEFIAAEALAA